MTASKPKVIGCPIHATSFVAWVGNHVCISASVLANTFTALSLLLAICALRAQAPAPAAYRVAGRILNAATGLPVRAASVSLLDEDNTSVVSTTLSDPDGNFAFEHLPAGKFPLTASKRGFRTSFYDEHDEFSSAIVTGPGQDTTHLSFLLKPGAVLYGTISGDGGDPVEGASVMLFRAPSHPGERVTQANTVTTDDAGNYEFADLPDGSYYIAVQAQPWYAMHTLSAAASSSPLDVAYPLTFYDSVTAESAAAPIQLEFGARQEANISLHAVPAVHVKVETGPGQNPGPVATEQAVFGIPVQWGDVQSAMAREGDSSGTMLSGLAPGHYLVTHGNPPRTVELDAGSMQEIAADAGSATVSVSGSVRTSTGEPVERGTVELDPGADARGRAALESPLQKGRFHIDGVAPGVWNLTVSAGGATQSETAVAYISDAGHSTSGNEIAVAERPLNLIVAVSRSRTKVQGFARRAGRPAPGAMIVLVPRDRRTFPSLARRDQSDTDGSFTLRDVPPGQYTAIAIADGWKLDWQRFDVIRRFLPAGVPVDVPEQAAVIRLSRTVDAASP